MREDLELRGQMLRLGWRPVYDEMDVGHGRQETPTGAVGYERAGRRVWMNLYDPNFPWLVASSLPDGKGGFVFGPADRYRTLFDLMTAEGPPGLDDRTRA